VAILRRFGMTSRDVEEKRFDLLLQELEHLLNSKCGYAWFDQKFGVNDASHFTGKSDITEFLVGEIQRNFELYAPRIEILSIQEEPHDYLSRVSFIIDCSIKESKHKMTVETNMGAREWTVRV
jgi:hypothetical protein